MALNLNASNDPCDVLGFSQEDLAETTPQVTALGYIGLIITLLGYPLCWIVFVVARNTTEAERLTKRDLPMITMLLVGFTTISTVVSASNAVGSENFDCHIFIIGSIVALVFSLLSFILRVFAFVCRIKFNQGYIKVKLKELAPNRYGLPGDFRNRKKGEEELAEAEDEAEPKVCCSIPKNCMMALYGWKKPNALPENLQFVFFLSSARFSIVSFILLAGALIGLSIDSISKEYFSFDVRCNGCAVQTGEDFFTVSGLFLVVTLIMLWSLRKYPDSFGVKQEIYVFTLFSVILHVLFVEIPAEYIPLLRIAERERRMDFNFFIVLENFIILFHQLPYQVYLARQAEADEKPNRVRLEEFVKDDSAIEPYLLYLATCKASENLLYYKATETWENDFDLLSDEERVRRATEMMNQFLVKDGISKINIAGHRANALSEEIMEKRVSKEMFSKTSKTVLLLLRPSFKGFFESSYYAAHQNSLVAQDAYIIEDEA